MQKTTFGRQSSALSAPADGSPRRVAPRIGASLSLLAAALVLIASSCNGAAPIEARSAVKSASAPRERASLEAPPARAPAPPMSLTASDGTGLALVGLTARVVVEDPLAFTELRLTFENLEDRVREGHFSVRLAPGATVSRFAMKIGDVWQEGEVVELQSARRAYEDFLHRKQDPALLEKGAGNEFTARVFPIPAGGIKEIILSYSQELGQGTPYVLPLRGLPSVRRLDVAVFTGEPAPVQELKLTDAIPSADFALDPAHARGGPGLRSQDLVLARVRPLTDSQPDPLTSAVVLLDTSASRALDFEDQITLLQRLVQKLVQLQGAEAPLTVGCYDQTTDLVFQGQAGSFGDHEIQRIRQRGALGASNLEQAIQWAGAQAKDGARKRVVLISDGVATAGSIEPEKLRAASLALRAAGVERLDAIAVGGLRDDALLRRLCTAGLLRDGVVADGSLDIATVTRKLTEATRSGIPVKVEGARWVWPQQLDGVQAGDEALIYAEVPPRGAEVKIGVGGGAPVSVALRNVERPLLERAWAQAKIESLVAQRDGASARAALQKEIVALSVAHRVLSPYTALLVLETERDYERFHIDRKALVDVLTVDGGRIARMQRSWPEPKESPALGDRTPLKRAIERRVAADDQAPVPRTALPPKTAAGPPAPPAAAVPARGNMWGDTISDSFGAGGLGLSGIGEGGGGEGEGIGLGSVGTVGRGAATPAPPAPRGASGQGEGVRVRNGSAEIARGAVAPSPRELNSPGRILGSHRPGPPTVRQSAATVSGRLSTEVIQGPVRAAFGRFRRCYDEGLRKTPTLQGRVAIKFVIDATGAVSSVTDGGSELTDPTVLACVAQVFKTLKFPAPGGIVTVAYPIHFAPGPVGGADVKPDRLFQAYTGQFKAVMQAIARGHADEAAAIARDWRKESPGDVLALVALGESFEALGEISSAARSYGSLIDLFSSRADLRRFAGERLERLRGGAGLDLALDTYEKAQAQRPDHPSSHRLLAFARLKKGDHAGAFSAALAGLEQPYPAGRFQGVDRILREDLGLIAAAWVKAEPRRREQIVGRVFQAGAVVEREPSLRFVLSWETDANDVDFHIHDDRGGHAFYGEPKLSSGGELYADVTTGYGPECFTIRGPKEKRAAAYTLEAHYYARGPMGYGMGKLQIVDHDGKGGITFDDRAFVAMVNQAYVSLGKVNR